MKKNITIVTLAAVLSAGIVPAGAQVIYKVNTKMNVTGVNNDGVAVGYPDLNTPYYLWRAVEKGPDQSAEDLELIGGMGPGDGIGGHPRFTDDGLTIAGEMMSDVELPSAWENTIDKPSFVIKDIIIPLPDLLFYGVAVGVDKETGYSVLLRTANEGQNWTIYDDGSVSGGLVPGEIKTITIFNADNCIVAGENGLCYKAYLGRLWWDKLDLRPDGVTQNVKSYNAVNFIDKAPFCGVAGVELEDGSYAVWYSADGGSTFAVATGVKGIPTSIVNDGTNFYMTTDNGYIQKSTDNGETWTEIYYGSATAKFTELAVSSEGKLAAVCGTGAVYISEDGGTEWNRKFIKNAADGAVWYAVTWNGESLFVGGSGGTVFSTDDLGNSWKDEADALGSSSDIYALSVNSSVMAVGGTNGCLSRKRANSVKENIAIAALYNMDTKEWSPLKSTGYLMDISAGSAYDISGDGSTVVGLDTWMEEDKSMCSHATVWNTETGMPVDLGSRYVGRATRANATNYDGSVVVGWQDFYGPWFASLWRKGADGYVQEFIYSRPGVSESDLDFNDQQNLENNLTLELQSVSSDGKWIGGKGGERSLIHNPYIYSTETGIIELTDNGVGGTVSDINNDGDIAIGWYGLGESGWIWTKEDGIMEINDFAKNVLGAEYEGTLCSAYDMSPNGRFVVGYGMGGVQEFFGYMLDLKEWLEDREIGTGIADVTVYPNPATDELHIDLLRDGKAQVNVYDLAGCKVYSQGITDASNVVDISSVRDGIYVLEVNTGTARKTMKFQVKH